MTLVEVVVAAAILSVVLVVSVPAVTEMRRAAALAAATGQLKGLFFRCRALALLNMRAYAVVFERHEDGSWRSFIAADGDDDGIRRADIESLIDPVIGDVIFFETGAAGLGIPGGWPVPDPSGRGRLGGRLDDPVRAGRGDIVTFTPRSTATPCSIYLTDFHSRMRVVRVYGGTGRVVSLEWRTGWRKWRRVDW